MSTRCTIAHNEKEGWHLFKDLTDDWTYLKWNSRPLEVTVPIPAEAIAAMQSEEAARLREDLREYVLDAFVQLAHLEVDGWYSTQCLSTVKELGEKLVEMGGWRRQQGVLGDNPASRMQWYRPIEQGE